jgi:hypothetical protein
VLLGDLPGSVGVSSSLSRAFSFLSNVRSSCKVFASAEEDEGDLRLMATSRIDEEEAADYSDSLSSVC